MRSVGTCRLPRLPQFIAGLGLRFDAALAARYAQAARPRLEILESQPGSPMVRGRWPSPRPDRNAVSPTPMRKAILRWAQPVVWIAAAAASSIAPSAFAGQFDCLIEPTQTVEVASPVTGLLTRINVKRGDRVAKGQVVALLESRAEQAAAELARFKSEQLGPTQMAQSKIEFSQRKFNRRREMTADRLMSPQERDDAEAELKQAESELQVAKENRQIARIEFQQQSSLLELRTIRSPLDGVVVDQMAYPGEIVEPGGNKKSILKLAQLDPLRVHVILPKGVFGKPSVGMTVDVSPEVHAKSRYVAKVKSIDRLIDAASGTFVVYLELPNSRLDIPAGVKCRATFPGF